MGFVVWSNYPLRGCRIIDLNEDILNYNLTGGVLIIDEAGIDINNRNFKNFSTKALEFYKTYRHYEMKIIILSQSVDFDAVLVRLISDVYFVEKGLFPFYCKCIPVNPYLDIRERSNLSIV